MFGSKKYMLEWLGSTQLEKFNQTFERVELKIGVMEIDLLS